MENVIRWGIFGTGQAAKKFANDIRYVDNCELIAIASRTEERGKEFALLFEIENYFGDYKEFAEFEEIDAVYIATPHVTHLEYSLLCLENKKAVLCEKPITTNSFDTRKMVAAAEANNTFLMEAMWTYFFPAIRRIKQIVDEGQIGEIEIIKAEIGYEIPFNQNHRSYDIEMGGSGLLDFGIYTIAFSQLIKGDYPQQVKSLAHTGSTRVDEYGSILLYYQDGCLAELNYSLKHTMPNYASIQGTKGVIYIPFNFWETNEFILKIGDNAETIEFTHKGLGYHYEIDHVNECLRNGLTESPIYNHQQMMDIMKIVDRVIRKWGVR
jgi:predicted dehydrogenase